MPVFGSRFTRLRLVQTALWVMVPSFALPVYAADDLIAQDVLVGASVSSTPDGKDAYTINFKNVSIIEYIRFISKITGGNFVFDENDLQFVVTIVSEEPATLENIFSALIQVLRINNLTLLEHEGNYVITRNPAVTQIPTIVSGEAKTVPLPPSTAIVTRVFRIKNTNVNSIAAIIRTMVSQQALVSVSNETNQLIVSDIVTNIEEIANLLASIDSPHSPLDIEGYHAKNVSPKELAATVQVIMTPFAEGNPLLFVPQEESNNLFIVSTPHLIDRAMAILQDLDVTPQVGVGQGGLFFYKVNYLPEDVVIDKLKQIAEQLSKSPQPPQALINMLRSAHFVKDSGLITFTGDSTTYTKVTEILATFDSASATSSSQVTFFIYPLKNNKTGVESALKQLSAQLKSSKYPNQSLIHTIDSMKYMSDTDSLIFTGTQDGLNQLQALLPTIEAQLANEELKNTFILYTPTHTTVALFEKNVKEFAATLKSAKNPDTQLIQVLESLKPLSETGSFTFHGSPDALARVKDLFPTLDSVNPQAASGESTYYLYKLQYADPKSARAYLDTVRGNLSPADKNQKNVRDVIEHAKIIKENNALLLAGPKEAVEEVKTLIAAYDTQDRSHIPPEAGHIFIYRAKNLSAKEVLSGVQHLVESLGASGNIDPLLKQAVKGMHYVEATDSLVVTGSDATLAQVKTLLEEVDAPSSSGLHGVGAKTFFIYKAQSQSYHQLAQSLKSVANDLAKGGLNDQELAAAIHSMSEIPETNSLVFTGTPAALQEVQTLISKFDAPALPATPATFVIYRPKFVPGDELIKILCDFIANLKAANVSNPELFDTVEHLRWIPNTCSLLVTGSPNAIAKVQDLLHQFDLASPDAKNAEATTASVGDTGFLIYKLQFHQGDDIQRALRRVASDLQESHKGQPIPIAEAIESLQWIPVTNSLLTSGPPDILSKVRELIQNLDIPLRQVFIEVLLIQTSVLNSQQFGLSWAGRAQYMNKLGGQVSNFGPSPSGMSPNLSVPFAPMNGTTGPNATNFGQPNGFDLGVIGDIILHKGKTFFSLGSLVQAIENDVDSTVVMNPKIIAQDSNNASMFFGFNVPFQGSIVTNISAQTNVSQSLEYRNVGHNLSITPTIGSGDIITLDISEDLSQVVNSGGISSIANSTTLPASGITTSQTTMATRVHVPDGHFVCLTGQINESKTHNRQQIPCLGGLPLIGAAFGNTQRVNDRENIIIFMRPQIVKTFDEYKRITEHQEDLYKSRASLPVVKEAIDDGIDMVKTPENE